MVNQSRVLTCHHIQLESGCEWCAVYFQQAVRQCDRCKGNIQTDMVFLSTLPPQPQLICVYCHHDETVWGNHEDHRTGK